MKRVKIVIDKKAVIIGAAGLVLTIGIFFAGYGFGVSHEKNSLDRAVNAAKEIFNPTSTPTPASYNNYDWQQ